jgi:DNA-binding MarR family transcriptional regulator
MNWLDEREYRAWIGYRRMRLLLDAQINRDLAEESGLSEADYDVLSVLSEAAGHRWRLTRLADRMLWSKSRLSRHIGRMEQRGLVVRDLCEDDARGALVVLTEAGLQTIQEAAPGHVASVRRHLIDQLTPAQLEALASIAEAVLGPLGGLPTEPYRRS